MSQETKRTVTKTEPHGFQNIEIDIDIEATDDGLQIADATVPWEWILRAMAKVIEK